jgi:hypothetical protein
MEVVAVDEIVMQVLPEHPEEEVGLIIRVVAQVQHRDSRAEYLTEALGEHQVAEAVPAVQAAMQRQNNGIGAGVEMVVPDVSLPLQAHRSGMHRVVVEEPLWSRLPPRMEDLGATVSEVMVLVQNPATEPMRHLRIEVQAVEVQSSRGQQAEVAAQG